MKTATQVKGKRKEKIRSVAKRVSLKSLVAKIKPENIHPETDWGLREGKEVW